jgi:TetR/AcrR family transcriptional regulator, transcriptional repressor for nem operon
MGRVSDAKERLMEAIAELIWTGSYGRTTIDQICEKAGVKKGSFYYFFKSKAELAAVAIDEEWQKERGELDRVFSATVPPLERLARFCELKYREQVDLQKKHGCVLGCPLCTLGTEVSTQDQILRAKVEEIMRQIRRYIESAIRDAKAEGSIEVKDVAATANVLFAYMEGLLAQARIQNDVELFKGMSRGVFMILGVKQKSLLAA